MPPYKQYLFKPRARQDLEGIYDYTVSEFGEEQADLYIRNLLIPFNDWPKHGALLDAGMTSEKGSNHTL